MKSLRWLFWSALALSSVPSLAWADEPSPPVWAERRVQDGLLKPLAKQESKRSRFSRERPPPSERRARITQTTEAVDKRGRSFLPFAVDVRWGDSSWHPSDLTGCVYRGSGELFVKIGDAYRPAAYMLGKNVEAVADVCVAAPPARS